MTQVKAHIEPLSEIRRFTIEPSTTFEQFKQVINNAISSNSAASKLTTLNFTYEDDEGDQVKISTEHEWSEALKLTAKSQVLRIKITTSTTPQETSKPQHGHHHRHHHHGDHHHGHQQHHNPWHHWRGHHGWQHGTRGAHHQYPQQQKQCNWMEMAQQYLPQVMSFVQNAQQVHQHVVCDGCNEQGIQGVRFKCNQCPDFDLCGKCHIKANEIHDASHSFTPIETPLHGMVNSFLNNMTQQQQQATPTEASTSVPERKDKQPASTSASTSKSDEPVEIEMDQDEPVKNAPVPQLEMQLSTLQSMGFTNTKLNEHLLKHHNGNLQKVIEALVNIQ